MIIRIYNVLLLLLLNIISPHLKSKNEIDVSKLKIAEVAEQIFIVYPDAYTSSKATVHMYEKTDSSTWEQVFETRGFIGKNGLGKRVQGDNKTPVGLYDFTTVFGILDDPGCKLKYNKVDETHYWDGDSKSTMYNKFVSTRTYKDFDMQNSEHLIDYKPQYYYGININYNAESVPFKGNAIFLHVYGTSPYTGGCVSINEKLMKLVVQKITKKAYIIIDLLENIDKY